MPTAAERQALAFLAGVALLGGGARVWTQHRDGARLHLQNGVAISAESVEGQLSAIDSAKASHRAKKREPKAPKASASKSSPSKAAQRATTQRSMQDEPPLVFDVDVANAEELERLPRVGPALAARIVANRDSFGAFGSLEALGQVRGIGPAMLKILSPVVTFSARPRASVPKNSAAKVRHK